MEFLNQFHKEAMERTIRKMRDAEKDPMSPRDFVAYMWRNYRIALEMEKEVELK